MTAEGEGQEYRAYRQCTTGDAAPKLIWGFLTSSEGPFLPSVDRIRRGASNESSLLCPRQRDEEPGRVSERAAVRGRCRDGRDGETGSRYPTVPERVRDSPAFDVRPHQDQAGNRRVR